MEGREGTGGRSKRTAGERLLLGFCLLVFLLLQFVDQGLKKKGMAAQSAIEATDRILQQEQSSDVSGAELGQPKPGRITVMTALKHKGLLFVHWGPGGNA